MREGDSEVRPELRHDRCADAPSAPPEREKLIRATWADRRRWIARWDVRRHPRWNVVPPSLLFRPAIPSDPDRPLPSNYLTFEYQLGSYGHPMEARPERWFRIVCEGLVLTEGPANASPTPPPA